MLAAPKLKRTRPSRFSVRVAKSTDLDQIASLDVNEYHKSTVDLEGLQNWFQAYHRGAFVLEDFEASEAERIIGAFGLWPITQAAFNKIIVGKMDEDEITDAHIRPAARRPRYKYWYLADIIVAQRYRRTSLSKSRPGLILLVESLTHWAKFGDFDEGTIEVCAIAAGEEGEGAKLLEAFGFATAKTRHGTAVKTSSDDTVYLRSISAAERADIVERIRRLFVRRTRIDTVRTVAGWLILIGAAGGFALGLHNQFFAQKLGYQLDDWTLQMGGLVICGLSLLLIKNKEMRVTIVAAGLIPLALKLLKMA
jgi:hypothetical protein